jgi:pilus assembly protein CpaF
MEQSFKSFRKDLQLMKGKQDKGAMLDFMEALEVVRKELGSQLMSRMDETENKNEILVKDKNYLRAKKAKYEDMITDIVYQENIRVRGYDDLSDFIQELVGEFAGYSVLEDAFNDPEVSDIYVIRWNLVIVEKRGVNTPYQKTFRSPKHYKDVLERFVRESGKEINLGDNSIVDFELYGDRGCATSPRVTPEDYSLTFRKHSEDHINRDDLINYGVINEEMADLLGKLIVGESNLIYAGLTGSGKTTTIRALLDHYVSQANKRMLVAEDTQELFPQNEHTLQLVSVKSDDSRVAVPLSKLIYTALRLKPKYIIVGEVRAEEAQAMVEGMETGHSTITTMHGGNPWNIINRLVTKYLMAMPSLGIDVVERIIGSSLDYICIQDNIPGVGRKCTSVTEVTYNFETRRVEMKTIVRFDFTKGDFVFENKISREKAETMLRRGLKWDEIKQWVE